MLLILPRPCLSPPQYTYHPQVLYCYGKPLCTIPRDSPYYGCQNRYVYIEPFCHSAQMHDYIVLNYMYIMCNILTSADKSIVHSKSCFLRYVYFHVFTHQYCCISQSFLHSRYIYCPKCFSEIQGDTVTVGDDPLSATRIPKLQFKELKNNAIDREP